MAAPETAESSSGRPRLSVGRVLLLLITGVCLYLFAPSIAEVFEASGKLGEVHPAAIPVILSLEFLSFLCVWQLQRLSLRTHGWFPVVTTQLAGNAFNRITPGGGATGRLQAKMLVDAGFNAAKSATAITVQSLLITAAVVAMPLFALPAILLGTSVPGSLADAVWIGVIVFAVMAVVFALLLGSERPLLAFGRLIQRVANRLRRRRPHITGLPERMVKERDEIRHTLGEHWYSADRVYAIGRWFFEYLVLVVTLYAIGASPDIWLVLLVFVAASVLGMIPFSPGGLGFVEAGLAATLALSGITTAEAVLATLVFRLVSFWLPIPLGFGSWWVFRRRYPRARPVID